MLAGPNQHRSCCFSKALLGWSTGATMAAGVYTAQQHVPLTLARVRSAGMQGQANHLLRRERAGAGVETDE